MASELCVSCPASAPTSPATPVASVLRLLLLLLAAPPSTMMARDRRRVKCCNASRPSRVKSLRDSPSLSSLRVDAQRDASTVGRVG
jgi:hypothetical protein